MRRLSLDLLKPELDTQGLRLGMPYHFVHGNIPFYQTHAEGHEMRKNKHGVMSVACDRFARYSPYQPDVKDRFWFAESINPAWGEYLLDFRIVPYYYKDNSDLDLQNPAVREVASGLCDFLNRMCELYGSDRLLTPHEVQERLDQCWKGERETLTLRRRIIQAIHT